ncbi:salicylic acid-binding 2 [Olea europaea subsp. europaea]|uniref:Salicylic acid-binding 2 n=1 Tax=Olea europaea subsp. europaea TaxID=158383 RepID=A0A8S0RIR6_OLEEU|nr:salicylic acid-binding 2 [Olea europaea subsp. europaea]
MPKNAPTHPLLCLFCIASVCAVSIHTASSYELSKRMEEKHQRHFVLVHGACLGAWSWYKLQPLLKAAGHDVTVLDLSASGIDPRSLDELRTFPDYTLPLFKVMESIPPDEKVVLVGHSLGGLNLAFAMEKYPEKISLAVFLGATMPDTIHRPSFVLEKNIARIPRKDFLDTKFASFGRPEDNLTSILWGPNFLSSALYQLSPPEVK